MAILDRTDAEFMARWTLTRGGLVLLKKVASS